MPNSYDKFFPPSRQTLRACVASNPTSSSKNSSWSFRIMASSAWGRFATVESFVFSKNPNCTKFHAVGESFGSCFVIPIWSTQRQTPWPIFVRAWTIPQRLNRSLSLSPSVPYTIPRKSSNIPNNPSTVGCWRWPVRLRQTLLHCRNGPRPKLTVAIEIACAFKKSTCTPRC